MRAATLVTCAVLAACIERPESGRLKAANVDRSKLGDVLLAEAPAPRYPANAVFDERIELVGVDVSPDPAQAGEDVTVTAYYRVLEDVGEDWKVFVHIDDDQRASPRTNADHWPARDRYRTAAWRKGEVVKDVFSFRAPEAGAERLEIWTGFFSEGDRLAVSSAGRAYHDGANRLRVAVVRLR